MIKVYPSLLAVDILHIADSIKKVEDLADAWHIDIMDGHFVPNLSFGPSLIKALKNFSDKPIDVHLMVEKPEIFVDSFISAGTDHLGFHVEATYHPQRLIKYIKSKGVKPYLVLNPATSLSTLEYLLQEIDTVLIMTVNPGFGGQEFLPFTLKKIQELREKALKENLKLDIMVDGGIDLKTAPLVVERGANILISGVGIFENNNPRSVILAYKSLSLKEV
ncbi:MAG: ribulose-phosphate 3-epimerase [Dictyoglomus sp.]|nr:ribulose-phosphate 3-epimerase [Dictyoglomus sp.]MCX7942569.1 ribulose-phosphate 3-epimerase [Dictyoglomaceae bacterium]MDW8188807.1 ribulose-phosphate 3-epimerase [Dictyoglomus sp.]